MHEKLTVSLVQDRFEALADVPSSQVQFLIDEGSLIEYPQDSFLFKAEEPADFMTFILEGHFRIFLVQKGNQNLVTEIQAGDITGLLPFSRMKKASANAQATENGWALQFPREKLHTLITQHYELTESLVHLMVSRTRTFTTLRQQNERMIALGKLSAGLAHELNNPTAAIARSSKTLSAKGASGMALMKKIVQLPQPLQYLEIANALLQKVLKNEKQELSLLERQSREDDWEDFFEDLGLSSESELIEYLIEYDIESDFIEEAFEDIAPESREALLKYLEFELGRQELLGDIETAAVRISDLVASIKNFTHMDSAQDKAPALLSEGIDSTLKILEHKIRNTKVQIIKDYDAQMGKVPIYAGQLNQVFTNILDNAIDVLKDQDDAKITIRTFAKHDLAYIQIIDNGPGIPEDMQSSIFDPFFTTKGIGEGTGMGLDISRNIVEQHQGKLELESAANPTIFRICIPLKA
ncbi:MAG: ATP-binding protein [Croceimicrobium sp.]